MKNKTLMECKTFKQIDIMLDDILDLARANSNKYYALFTVDNDSTALFARSFVNYRLTASDVIIRIKAELNKEDGFDYQSLFRWSYELSNSCFLPIINDHLLENYNDVSDCLFDNNVHFIKYAIRVIKF